MADIPRLLEEKNKEKHRAVLEQIFIRLATNSRALEESEFKRFIESVTSHSDVNQLDHFDRDKFEELRFMTNQGANRIQ
jgi:hypothetical protein